MPFRLLYLPYLALEEVIKSMNHVEICLLSTASKPILHFVYSLALKLPYTIGITLDKTKIPSKYNLKLSISELNAVIKSIDKKSMEEYLSVIVNIYRNPKISIDVNTRVPNAFVLETIQFLKEIGARIGNVSYVVPKTSSDIDELTDGLARLMKKT
uniref:F-box domain-containing protein n=1 Tax=Caenorhabditis tropicalis TaxID=1561998 RepID=A0A1I7T0B9_9PELO